MPLLGALQSHPSKPFLFLQSDEMYTQTYANYQHTYDVPIKLLRALALHSGDVCITEDTRITRSYGRSRDRGATKTILRLAGGD